MRLGIVTDIHEHVEFLRAALRRLEQERVDQVVFVGDLVETGGRLEETCQLLAEVRAVGVWGNHDVGLCLAPDARLAARYGPKVIEYMTSLRPRLDVGGCHFTHVEPWLDSENVLDLWYYEGPPDELAKLSRIFNAVPNRLLFSGHYHRWLLVRPEGIDAWNGERAVRLDQGRYFVVIGALCDGCFAVFDTETSELTPYKLAAPVPD